MSFGIPQFFTNSGSDNRLVLPNPRLKVRSATGATPLAVVNVAQGPISADSDTRERK